MMLALSETPEPGVLSRIQQGLWIWGVQQSNCRCGSSGLIPRDSDLDGLRHVQKWTLKCMTLKGSDLRDLTVEYVAASVKVLVTHISTVLCVIKNGDGCQSPRWRRGWLVLYLLSSSLGWAGGVPIIHFLHFGGSGLWLPSAGEKTSSVWSRGHLLRDLPHGEILWGRFR